MNDHTPRPAQRRRRLIAWTLCFVLIPSLVLSGGPLAWLAAPATHAQQADDAAEPEPFGLDYIPRDALLVLALRPAALAERRALQPIREALDAQHQSPLPWDLEPGDVAELRVVLIPGRGSALVILRAAGKQAADKFSTALRGAERERRYAGQTYYQIASEFYLRPDERTLVLTLDEALMRRCIVAGAAGAASTRWAAKWDAVARRDAAIVVNTSLLRGANPQVYKLVSELAGRQQGIATPPLVSQLAPLWQNSEFAVADLKVADEVELRIASQSATAAEAGETYGALLNALSMIRRALAAARDAAAREPGPLGPEILKNISIADEVLEKARLARRGNQIGLYAKVDAERARRVGELAAPALLAARAGALRDRSLNNLKQIAIAFHNYHDTYRTFPAAAQIGPKNIPHSWRVTLLPFLEQLPLFQEYRQDEPWDSPHNLQVAAKMPDVFRCPLDRGDSTNTSYFALSGVGTAMDSQRCVKIRDIRDGTSNTILVVESRREVPWTKPEDIPFDANAPPPKLGGWYPGGFCTALCDASVHFLSDSIDGQILIHGALRDDRMPLRLPER